MESREMVLMNYLQDSSGNTDIKNRLVGMVGGGERGTNWKSNTETYITTCKTDSQWDLPYNTGSSNLVLCDNLEEWDGGGKWEGGSGGRGHVYTYGWFMLMHGRNQHNIVKQLSSN